MCLLFLLLLLSGMVMVEQDPLWQLPAIKTTELQKVEGIV